MRAIFLFCFILFVSCESPQTISPPVIGNSLTAVDAQKVFVLQSGSIFQVSLPSNPSTGFSWVVDIENPEIVQMLSKSYVANKSGRMGVGGDTRWVFQADGVGKSNITFSYQRQWEKEVKPSRVVTFKLDVR